jgi:hypothetical protein
LVHVLLPGLSGDAPGCDIPFARCRLEAALKDIPGWLIHCMKAFCRQAICFFQRLLKIDFGYETITGLRAVLM